jgi:hypothetical protein
MADPTKGFFSGAFDQLLKGERPSPGNRIKFAIDTPTPTSPDEKLTLSKSITNLLNGEQDGSIERLAFETDPNLVNQYQSVYRAKVKLLPDALLKRIIIQDDLVAAIVRARETQMGGFGRPRRDRYGTGFVIEANPGVLARMSPDESKELDTRIQKATRLLQNCGSNESVKRADRMSFSQFLQMTTRNAVGLGRIAIELIYKNLMDHEGSRSFHHFRPVDAGTIMKATPQQSAAEAVRKQAIDMLRDIKGPDFNDEKVANFEKDAYTWIQVVDSRPVQAFTDDEMVVHNFYPVLDVELDGYPVTPIDTMISNVTTHINITTHNKIYFQTGRAARGMLVFKSDDVDESTLQRVKQQFNASINSVNNAWRMPVFACGTNDEISWQPIDNSSRDAEFQYLTDMNARVILSAFQMSPDELPGWSYLSRGTNNQSLSESNNEYRMEAARDQGIRPLLAQFEEFINTTLLPLIDENLAKLAQVRLVGLDALTEEKEGAALTTAIPIHMTMDEVLKKVEKQPLGAQWGGNFPLNPQWSANIDKYLFVDEIVEHFFNRPKDPSLHYIRDPFHFQMLQMQMQMQQMQQQQQAAAAQPAASPQPGGGGGSDGSDGGGDQQPSPAQQEGVGQEQQGVAQNDQGGGGQQAGEDLARSIDQATKLISPSLSKGEEGLPMSRRRALAQQRLMVERLILGLENDERTATDSILAIARKHKPKEN